MGRTQLFQKPGSPLIQGHSRAEQPFWRDWLMGSLGAWIVLCGLGLVIDPSSWGNLGAVLGDLMLLLAYSCIPAPLGSALGVWLAARMGWRRRWVSAVVLGLLAAVALITVRALTMG